MSRPSALSPDSFRRGLRVLLLLLILLDLGYSAVQHYHQPLDGDVAWNLVPHPEVVKVLQNPFGTLAWREDATYPNPNRFFAHWSFRGYFLPAPLLLQRFTDPVHSVYLAAAFARAATQLLLLLLLARAVVGHWRILSLPFLTAAVLLTPFFQTNGYRAHIGIIDPSVTYTFFYALPAAALLLFLLPFIDRFRGPEKAILSVADTIVLAALAPVVCLSGPLNPATVGVITAVGIPLLGPGRIFSLPRRYLFLWTWVTALAAYALWLGTFNSLTIDNRLPLAELYARLPEGILRQFTTKLAWPLLLVGIAINGFLLRRCRDGWLRAYPAVFAFSALYILLLPLGGFREYRALLLRYDTTLPITLACLWLYAGGTLALFKRFSGRRRLAYTVLPATLLLAFTLADRPAPAAEDCERRSLYLLAASKQDTVPLADSCPVLDWLPQSDPAASTLNAELLYRWRVTDRPRLYFNTRR